MPRPKVSDIEITDQLLNEVERLSAEGYTIESIAMKLRMSRNTFIKVRKENPQVQEAVLRGRFRDDQMCKNRLRMIAFDDNHKNHLTALLAYGKIMHKWNDGSRLDDAMAATQLPKSIPTNLEDDTEEKG